MGRNHRSKRLKTRDANDDRAVWKQERWAETPISQAFIDYYKAQGLVEDHEWDRFQASCETPLPITFRFNANVAVDAAIDRLKRHEFDSISDAEPLDNIHPEFPITTPSLLPWYKDEMAWKIGATKRQLKKHPRLSELNKWLTALNENGFISRQEAVSMIPALLLDVNSDHAVLDSCAAPGSKTAQILEMVSAAGSLSKGFVIANDASPVRANNLTHQLNRLCLPCFVVCNHEAQHFPSLTIAENARLMFDRILCDVPCSGDGTVRKNSEIWAKWSTSQGVGLHRLQLQIVQRALQLLKSGGRIVYSTCSFNPIENEAVVAEILRRSNGTVQLLDVSDALPGLVRRAGRSSWKVLDRDLEFRSFDEVPELSQKSFPPSIFPPTPDEAASFHLDRALRLLPHDQDTGGFFVAVLSKSSSATIDEQKATPTVPLDVDAIRKRLKNKHKGEVFFRISDFPEHRSVIDELVTTFGLSHDFPTAQLWCRSSNFDTIGRIYLMNKAVDSILEASLHCYGPRPLKIIHAGLLVFENSRRKNPRAPPYRISHTGAAVLLPFMNKRVQRWPVDRFRQLLANKKFQIEDANDCNDEYGSILVVCDLPKSTLIATCWATADVIEVMMNQSTIDCLLSSLDPNMTQ